jgi:cell division cycle 20-like protein 1 (cofactor of APC complex)
MKWSYGDDQLASGGNDNKLLVWSTKLPKIPQYKFTDHVAAVKALAWSPHQHGILVSGGGTADRCIKFWNTLTGEAVKSFDTGSQVCNIDFSKNNNEIVSTHGFSQDPDSQNQIIVWKSPSMKKIASLKGHTYRVLYLAQSPDGQNIVTGAGDETLRFWNVFPAKERQQSKKESVLDYNSVCLR